MKCTQIIDHIARWLKEYLEKSTLKGFCIGVSGGIDSAVTSTLCAITEKPVMVLNMPIYQEKDQVSRSCDHIAWLEKKFSNVTGADVELTSVFDEIKTAFPDSIQDGMTMSNTRSRLRMLTLYAFASHHRMLVTGTGNKIEDFGVGFYTKYGDGGVDISPIADLNKTQVYRLGRELGIIENILTAVPTDGLWEDNRSDESQLGASYQELEWAMQYIEMPRKLPLNRRQKKVLAIYREFHNVNKHKMEPIPVCTIPDKML